MLLAIRFRLQKRGGIEDMDDMTRCCRFGLFSDVCEFADRLACPFVVLDYAHP